MKAAARALVHPPGRPVGHSLSGGRPYEVSKVPKGSLGPSDRANQWSTSRASSLPSLCPKSGFVLARVATQPGIGRSGPEFDCGHCGIKFMEFRAGGRLGCPQDYRVFSAGLLPLVQRYHGATRHVGKAARLQEGAGHRLRLRTQLREAIAREDYEQAARLRDQLRLKDPMNDPR